MLEKSVNAEATKSLIRQAFSAVEYPGDWCLRGSNEGDEPYELEAQFKGKTEWRTLEPSFLDQASGGLCFFSDEAFRFYLPAFLIADIDGGLSDVWPFHDLCHGFSDVGKVERVNPRRYGERTWFETARYKMAVFDRAQVEAIVAYLEIKRTTDEHCQDMIDEALTNYWRRRAAGEIV